MHACKQVVPTLKMDVRVSDEWEANQEWDTTAAELRAAKIHILSMITELWQKTKKKNSQVKGLQQQRRKKKKRDKLHIAGKWTTEDSQIRSVIMADHVHNIQ